MPWYALEHFWRECQPEFQRFHCYCDRSIWNITHAGTRFWYNINPFILALCEVLNCEMVKIKALSLRNFMKLWNRRWTRELNKKKIQRHPAYSIMKLKSVSECHCWSGLFRQFGAKIYYCPEEKENGSEVKGSIFHCDKVWGSSIGQVKKGQ